MVLGGGPDAEIAVQVTASRNEEAGRCLRWAIQATQSLAYLSDLHASLPSTRQLPGGHDLLAVHVAHARWAATTATTAVDLCSAVLGLLYLPTRRSGRYYDFRELSAKVRDTHVHCGAREWLGEAVESDDFRVVDGLRDPLAHRTLGRHYAVKFTARSPIPSATDHLVQTSFEVDGNDAPIAADQVVLTAERCARHIVGSFLARAASGRI